MTQNQAIIDPEARPTTKNKTLTIPAVSACCNFTVLGAKIINTLVRYPFVSPKIQVSIITGISVRKNFGPCKHPKKRGKNNSLAMQLPIAIFAFSRRNTAVSDFPTRSNTLKQVIRRIGYQSLRS
ncbi:equilibrative nucleotide transporter [Trifolium repens]|nr:equilibrative nucleotide transporter [Trifolium repens]